MNDDIITIINLNKEYKMFARKKDRLLETVLPWYRRHNLFIAIQGLNLELKKGEVLGILGKNGAGKSTLLKMITGVVTPTSGSIQVKGKISSLLELGTSFNVELTGIDNIYQHGQVMGLTNQEIKSKEQEIIDFADIGDHLFQPVKTYSSGMFARLAFACAINVEPDILIVDEVLSVGDMAFQLKCFKKFEQFKKAGKTIIFVTHNIGDVLRNCTRTVIISEGRKIFDGDVKGGVEKYKKIIVGLDDKESKEELLTDKEELSKNKNYKKQNSLNDKVNWKKHFTQNPNLIEYGNGKASIIDYGMFNKDNYPISNIDNCEEIAIKMKIKFNEKVSHPIFAIAIKDFKGIDLCGSNTLANKIHTKIYEKDEIVEVVFTQLIPIAPGKYTLSFGCTRFNEKGELDVLDRKYDALLLEVISINECLGLVHIDSQIDII